VELKSFLLDHTFHTVNAFFVLIKVNEIERDKSRNKFYSVGFSLSRVHAGTHTHACPPTHTHTHTHTHTCVCACARASTQKNDDTQGTNQHKRGGND